jgi:protein tyrosine phosphatase
MLQTIGPYSRSEQLLVNGEIIQQFLPIQINLNMANDYIFKRFCVFSSAGVGRTGVFLAIDMILDKLEKGVIDSIDVFGTVCAMRERRMNMVQTLVWIVL